MNAPFREWLDREMLRNVTDDRVDMGDWLRDRAVPEPEKSGFRFIVIGALAALSWLAVYAIWSAL